MDELVEWMTGPSARCRLERVARVIEDGISDPRVVFAWPIWRGRGIEVHWVLFSGDSRPRVIDSTHGSIFPARPNLTANLLRERGVNPAEVRDALGALGSEVKLALQEQRDWIVEDWGALARY